MNRKPTLRQFALAYFNGEQWAEDIAEFCFQGMHRDLSEFSFDPDCSNCLLRDECTDIERNKAMKEKFCTGYIPFYDGNKKR